MTEIQNIRRLSDGSIDFDHYVRHGRTLHGAAVRRGVRMVFGLPLALSRRMQIAMRRRAPEPRANFSAAAE